MIQKAREKIVPIVWVQHSDDAIKYKSDDWEIAPELSIDKGDYRIDKHYNSSFEETDLEKVLKTVVATQIVLVGAATNWCIRATAYGALDRGYDVTLISDAHTTKSLQLPTGKTINAEDVITDLNVALSWLRYPNRTNKAIKTTDFNF